MSTRVALVDEVPPLVPLVDGRGDVLRTAREVWTLGWPAITHMLLVTLVFFSSRAMVGRVSASGLASMQISGVLTWTLYSVFTALSAGTLAVVARSVGAGHREDAARASRASLAVALLLGALVSAAVLVANGALLGRLFPRADATVLSEAAAYLHIVLPVLPLAFVEAVAAASLQGAGDTRTPMYVATAGNLLNLALSGVLIFGKLGFPALGVRGAAIGTAATMAVEGIVLTAVLFSSKSPLPLARARASAGAWASVRSGPERQALQRVLRVSMPALGERVVYHAGYLAFVAVIGLLGVTAMAANQGLISIEAVSFLSADGLGVAAAAIVAQKLGARRADEARRSGWVAAAMATALLTVFGLLFALLPRTLSSLFSNDPEIVALGARTLVVAAAAQPFMAFATVLGMALRGAGDTRTVLWISTVCSLFIRLGATWFFAIVLGWGLVGVWIGSGVDWFCRAALLGVMFARGRWRTAIV